MMEAATLGALEAGKPVAGIRIQASQPGPAAAALLTPPDALRPGHASRPSVAACWPSPAAPLARRVRQCRCASPPAPPTRLSPLTAARIPVFACMQREAGTTVRTASYLPGDSQVFCRFLSSRKVALVDSGGGGGGGGGLGVGGPEAARVN